MVNNSSFLLKIRKCWIVNYLYKDGKLFAVFKRKSQRRFYMTKKKKSLSKKIFKLIFQWKKFIGPFWKRSLWYVRVALISLRKRSILPDYPMSRSQPIFDSHLHLSLSLHLFLKTIPRVISISFFFTT